MEFDGVIQFLLAASNLDGRYSQMAVMVAECSRASGMCSTGPRAGSQSWS